MAKIVMVDLNAVLAYAMAGEKKAEEKAEFISTFRTAKVGSIGRTTALTINPSTLRRWGEIGNLNGVITIKHKKNTYGIRVAEDTTEADHKTLRKAFCEKLKEVRAELTVKALAEEQAQAQPADK